LARACQEALDAQIAYGEETGLPWGISECAYSALDANQTYQYRAFGVPDLALNPVADPGPVVAPYATMLALLVDPSRSVNNLRQLETLGLKGPMGFYESIDFTRQSKKGGNRGVVTFAYMAHHQGMTLLALNNLLLDSRMQTRFHADLRIRSVRSLLFERIPTGRTKDRDVEPTYVAPPQAVVAEPAERTWTESTPLPQVHLNSNGRYSLMVTNTGGGYSRWKGIDLTRWRSDSTLDDWGTFCWIREGRTGAISSPARRPFGNATGAPISATFSPDRAEFRRQGTELETTLEVTVATGEDAELRRVILTNRSLRSQTVEVNFYTELALTLHVADRAHPVFEKLFIQTEALDESALLAWRRPRSEQDVPIFVGCVLLGAGSGTQHETSRPAFLGRGNNLEAADALLRPLKGTTGTVIDPIFSLRCQVDVGPRESRTLTFVLMAGSSREEVVALIAKFRRPEAVPGAFDMAWTRAQLELRYLAMRPSMVHRFQELASHMLYPFPRLRATHRIPHNALGQADLWRHGISGDLPILVLTVGDLNGLPVLKEALLAWQFWRIRGLDVDLIVLNREQPSYDAPLRNALSSLIEAQGGDRGTGTGKVFLIDWQGLTDAQHSLLLAVARVVLGAHLGPLQRQLLGPVDKTPTPRLLSTPRTAELSPQLPFLELPYFNGLGGFSQQGHEYAIYLSAALRTPAPWANVIANPRFGTVLTESGLGFTWFGNSQRNRLTPWHNDPVRDPQSEVIYIRDEDTGTAWTPTALPIRESEPYRARHGQGYTTYEHNSHAIAQELTVFVAESDPVKLCRLTLRNHSTRARRLSVTFYVEWVLGSVREEMVQHLRTSHDADSGAITASQSWTGPYTGQVAFAASSPPAASYSCDRTSFLGRDGSAARPAVMAQASLDNRCNAGGDPCAALQVQITLAPGEQRDVTFLLGSTDGTEVMRTLVARYQDPAAVEDALRSVRQAWDSRLNTIQVKTPVLSVDFLLNRWLPYQTLSCRFWARSAVYQSGGAVGFRDQLQDSLALIYSQPQLTRAHILTAASRQFPEGDVQHWWHAESGLGVRTRCSDDSLWLPWVTLRYVAITGDLAILDEPAPFLEGPTIPEQESESMFQPTISTRRESLWEHCRCAIQLACTRLGPHGLPLFGSGDWNDGLNRVGAAGRGESIWLAWFLISILKDASDLDPTFADLWRQQAQALEAATEAHGWDGEWYLRGFFDDGSPLGSHHNSEARIDSLPQSWAILSGAANPERSAKAMAGAEQNLVKSQDGIVLLFTPPFDHSAPHPGYIMGYPPGVRENGGQYTHGSLWMAQARARMLDGDRAVGLLQLMNPVERTRSPQTVAAYRGEPFAVAADVSAAPGRVGASGWTWYTGSSAWMYRIWLEDVLGFRKQGSSLRLMPAIPDAWPGFEIRYRFGNSTYLIEVARGPVASATLDGQPVAVIPDPEFPLLDDGQQHRIQIVLSDSRPASNVLHV
jgi:cyclic beta-1,2-glucan synthetase